jgi:hypothetical protein
VTVQAATKIWFVVVCAGALLALPVAVAHYAFDGSRAQQVAVFVGLAVAALTWTGVIALGRRVDRDPVRSTKWFVFALIVASAAGGLGILHGAFVVGLLVAVAAFVVGLVAYALFRRRRVGDDAMTTGT